MQLFTARCTLDGKLQSAVLRSHVVRLSVCASVMLADCDLIGWKSSEIISPLVSLGCSLSADPNIRGLLQGEHPEILARIVTHPLLIWASAAFDRKLRPNGYIIAQRSQRRAGKPPSLFAIADLLRLPLPPKWGFHMLPRYANGHLRSGWSDRLHSMFGSRVGFSGSAGRMAVFPITSNPRWLPAAIMENFEWPSAQRVIRCTSCLVLGRAVIFAIAQLSCYIACRRPKQAYLRTPAILSEVFIIAFSSRRIISWQ